MAVTPVIPATQLLIRLNTEQLCNKEEGVGLCNQLVEWVSDSNRADYHEAAMLVFFLAETLRRKEVISMKERDVVFNKGKDTIERAKVDRVLAQFLSDRGFPKINVESSEKIPCPNYEICCQLIELRKKSKEQVTCEGKPLFEKLIQWMSKVEYDENDKDYGLSSITIFSIALELLERECISESEKTVMFHRAFQVILRFPEHKIKDAYLIEFLEQRGLKE